jgi:redox-sensitive bicupin YhaK (pirin superfamily)
VIRLRKSADRGVTRLSWLESRHSFSFGDYFDPDHSGYRSLRVLNEDVVAPDRGFATHAHRDMEILSVVYSGSLEHRDSLGTGSVIRPGDVQRMTAGTGVLHSEFNPSATEPVRFLQIWIQPERTGLHPSYEQKSFNEADRQNRFCLIASPDGSEGSIAVHQQAKLYTTELDRGHRLLLRLPDDWGAWVQVVEGRIRLNDVALEGGDGAAVEDEGTLAVAAIEPARVLVCLLK